MPPDQELRLLRARSDCVDPNLPPGKCDRSAAALLGQVLAEDAPEGNSGAAERTGSEGKEAAFVHSVGVAKGGPEDARRNVEGRDAEGARKERKGEKG